MKNLIYILSFTLLSQVLGCASTPKRLAEIDLALTDIQAGHTEEGRAALTKMCASGQTGPCALVGQSAISVHPVPILQSVTSNTQARFAVFTPGAGELAYYVRGAGHLVKLKAEYFGHAHDSGGIDQIEAFALDPKVEYELIVIGPKAEMWDKRSFHALNLNQRRTRLAVASALDDKYIEQQKIWPELLRQKPDAILLVGDNAYVDRGTGNSPVTADSIWRRNKETRQTLALFKANPLVPVLATWNDHDYGKTDGDRTFTLKDAARDTFYAFFPQSKVAPEFLRGPGVASWWNAFGAHFALLDNRSFRSPNGVNLPDQTHFGLDQEKWLEDKLSSVREPVFLISGDEFFGGYHNFESYEGNHPASFKRQLEVWKKTKAPLVFISGDRRLSEIVKVPSERLGFSTFELTSSGIHAKVYADAFTHDPNPQQLVGAAGQYNFMMVEIMRAQRGLLQLDVQAFALGGKQLYQKTLMVKH